MWRERKYIYEVITPHVSVLGNIANGKGEKVSATKRGFDNVSSTPRKSNQSPLKKQVKKTPDEEETDALTILDNLNSEIIASINALLDS